MNDPARLNVRFRRGITWSDTFTYAVDNGSSVWVASRAYAGNAVVQASPDGLSPFPSILPLYYRALGSGGVAGATRPAFPTTYGATVVDGTITWICQATTAYTPDISGCSCSWMFRRSPEDPSSPILTLAGGSGIVLVGPSALITPTLTPTQIETLLAAAPYGAHGLNLTFPDTTVAPVLDGAWEILGSANR